MFSQGLGKLSLTLAVVFTLAAAMIANGSFAQTPAGADAQKSRSRRASAVPSPTPPVNPKEDLPQESEDVIRVETNLTNIFFTAADNNKRFVNTLRKEDIRILEDGQPQEIFTFQKNVDLPLSIGILIDTSRSEERTLPDEKAAARSFLEAVMRPQKDEAAVVSFTGEVTLEQGFTGNLERLRRAIDRVEFVPPSGYVGGGVVVGTPPISGTNQNLTTSTAIWDAVWVTSNDLLA